MTRLFVSNLPYTLQREELLQAVTSTHLTPTEATIAKLQRTGRPLGFAFLTFGTEEEAKRALSVLREIKFSDRLCRAEIAYDENVAKARKENLLFVGNLPEIATAEDLKNIFEGFKLIRAEITKHRNSDKSKGFGYVAFETKEEMEKALKTCAGTTVESKEIIIEVARPRALSRRPTSLRPTYRRQRRTTQKNTTSSTSTSSSSTQTRPREKPSEEKSEPDNEKQTKPQRPPREKSECSIYVGNLPFKADSGDVQRHFDKYKPKTAYVLRRKNGGSKGYAFVDFGSAADANAALALNGTKILDREITVNIAYTKIDLTSESK